MAQRSLIRLRDLFPDGAYAECACDDGVPCLAHYGLLEPAPRSEPVLGSAS